MSNVTFEYIKQNKDIRTYISCADDALSSIGYTEHSLAHVQRAADTAFMILSELGYPARDCELAQIAAYMHDIGNVVNRADHAHSGAIMAFRLLDKLGMPASEIALIISAIGNHDESTASPVNAVAAALIIADKTDVRRSRVRPAEQEKQSHGQHLDDIHDRVNYAVEKSELYFNDNKSTLTLELTIDLSISSVMEYFEIFLTRMTLCRRAAETLGINFSIVINGNKIM